jgi:DNA polymerase-3 subunit epsilon
MYAVLDTETTGLAPNLHHRVIEIGVALADANGEVEGEWCTLVNPDRDLGPQHIHGIRAADVAVAPRFEEVAEHLMSLLSGRTIVAHNLPFDLMFLRSEYERIGVEIPLTRDLGVCTMTWSSTFLPGAGRSLRECCSAAGVQLTGWHSASCDARATAGLLRRFILAAGPTVPWRHVTDRRHDIAWPSLAERSFEVQIRSANVMPSPSPTATFVAQLVDYMPRVDSSELADPYLAVLDQVLADRYVSADEDAALSALAESLGLTGIEISRLHRDYLNALARIALADHHLSDDEAADLERVAEILGLPAGAVAAALDQAGAGARPAAVPGSPQLSPGDMIVFTGDMAEPREVWMQRAAAHGYVPHPSVTKNVRLVVAADPDSLSGKAKKARGYGIPIIGIDEFRAAFGYGPGDTSGSSSPFFGSNAEREWAKILREAR